MKSLKIPLICLLASASLGLPLTACDGEIVGFPDTDTIAPAVSATTPINGAVAVATNAAIAATFTETMKADTFTTTTFALFEGATAVPGSVAYTGVTALFVPNVDLKPATKYSARILARVTDLAGNAMAADYAWTFTTGASSDTLAPLVSSTVPVAGATGVATGGFIAATFTEPMNPLTITGTTFTLRQGASAVPGNVSYSGITATFNPTTPLGVDTLYTATITTGAKDLGGNALGVDYVWAFTTGSTPDSARPTVSATVPARNATAVALNAPVTITFSESMKPSSLSTATVVVRQGATTVAGAVTSSGVTATFTASGGFAPDTAYTATVTTGATDLAGNALADDYTWTFTTGADPDTTAPLVTNTFPANGGTGITFDTTLAATFSEAMDPATITTATFTLRDGSTVVPGSVSYVGVTATFNPTAPLAGDVAYTATITTGARDAAGNALAADYSWIFTTGALADTTAPQVSATTPANGATNVAFNTPITATFSEPVDAATITTTTFALFDGATPVSSTVVYVGLTALLTPATTLKPDTLYTARILAAVTDLSGNPMTTDYVWTFTTGSTPDTTGPLVSSTTPGNGETGVAVNAPISATFSEAMNPATIGAGTFTLFAGATQIPGSVVYVGVTALFTPASVLVGNTTYTARISNTVKDLAGNSLGADYVWTFATGATADTTAPLVTSTTPGNGATAIATGSNILAAFSEAMNPTTITTVTFKLRQGVTPIVGTVSYAGVTAVFNPSAPLVANTTYNATITTGARDLAGNPMTADYEWLFTTGGAPDATAPQVSSTTPTNAETGVAINAPIAATFNEAMNPATITTAAFTLVAGTTPVPGTVRYIGVTALFTPLAALNGNTVYTARVRGTVTDLSGNDMGNDYVWSFTTGQIPDTTAPLVSSTTPANGATGVALDSILSATFSEAMNPLTINAATIRVTQGGGSVVTGTVTYSGVTATFNPTNTMAANAVHTVTVSSTVRDLAGNPMTADYVWTFTTGSVVDTTAPIVSSTAPGNGAARISLGSKVAVVFSEAMDPLTITNAQFTLRNGVQNVAGIVTYSGVTAVFSPVSPLSPDTLYTATITIGATDLAGNALELPYTWTFTTGETVDTTAPEVSYTAPANGATGVALGGNIAATFTEVMDPLTINASTFTLRQGVTVIAGTVTYAGFTAVFNPTAPLTASRTYTATITTGARDLAGNGLAATYIWSFTTGAVPDSTAPTVISTTPENGEVDVAFNAPISATFSEAMNPLTINALTFTVSQGVVAVPGTVNFVGTTAIFTPTFGLLPNAVYTARITTGVQDLAGNAMAATYTWTFNTGATPDASVPSVVSTTPSNGLSGVPLNANIGAVFSEVMSPLTINTTTFRLYDGTLQIPGTVTYLGATATFNPLATLSTNTFYTVIISTGATDLVGNPVANDYSWVFVTGSAADTTAPTVSSTTPVDGAPAFGATGNLTAVFSEAMNTLTINDTTFQLFLGPAEIAGKVSYSGANATFNPDAELVHATLYTARVTTVAADLAGNRLVANYVWTFTTAP
jgi:tetrahydromethanopterin S-methyltransferase subunit B